MQINTLQHKIYHAIKRIHEISNQFLETSEVTCKLSKVELNARVN